LFGAFGFSHHALLDAFDFSNHALLDAIGLATTLCLMHANLALFKIYGL